MTNTTLVTIGHYVIILAVMAAAVALSLAGQIQGSEAITVVALAGGVSIGSGVALTMSGKSLSPTTSSGSAQAASATPTVG